MDSTLKNILLYASIPVATAVVGGVVAAVRPPTARVRSYLQHFAAGVVFAALSVEILPDIVHRRSPVAAAIGFAAGVAAMLGIRSLTRRQEDESPDGTTNKGVEGLVVTVGVDVLIDGLLLGIAFVAGQAAGTEKQGVLLTVALATELLSLGLATSATLMRRGTSTRRSIFITTAIALLMLVGATAGGTMLSNLPNAGMEAVLAFAVAALLYLVTEELLVEAHEVPETPVTTATFFVGFLLLLLVDIVA